MDDNDLKPACKYGINCYQRNQAHKDRFSHPPNDQSCDESRRSSSPPPAAKKRKSSTPPAEIESGNGSNTGDDAEGGNDGNRELSQDSNEEVKDNSNGSVTEKENELNESTEPSNAFKSVEECPKTSGVVGTRCSEFIKESFDKGPHAQRAEYQKLLETPIDFIAAKFLVTMPNDFFTFWEFCESQMKNNSAPENLFNKFGLSLVGPFDVLAKKFHNIEPFEPGDYLRHWRFYYDPPEFQVRALFPIVYSK